MNEALPNGDSSAKHIEMPMNAGMKRKPHQLTSRLSNDPSSIARMQKLLLLLRHASKCMHSETDSTTGTNTTCSVGSQCTSMKKLWNHISSCRFNSAGNNSRSCSFPNCNRSRYALWHFKNCADVKNCPVCGPVRQMMSKESAAMQSEREKLKNHSTTLQLNKAEPSSKNNTSVVTYLPDEQMGILPVPSGKRQKVLECPEEQKEDFPLSSETMPSHDKSECEAMLRKLLLHEHGWVFSEPVDPVLLNIPDYFEVIEKPMDLGTIKRRLTEGTYTSTQEFKDDVVLTFDNALQYNQDGTEVHQMAGEMKNLCVSCFRKH